MRRERLTYLHRGGGGGRGVGGWERVKLCWPLRGSIFTKTGLQKRERGDGKFLTQWHKRISHQFKINDRQKFCCAIELKVNRQAALACSSHVSWPCLISEKKRDCEWTCCAFFIDIWTGLTTTSHRHRTFVRYNHDYQMESKISWHFCCYYGTILSTHAQCCQHKAWCRQI